MNSIYTALAASALPCFMVLVGILLNRNDTNRLDGRIANLEGSLGGRITGLEGSLRGEISGLRGEMRSEISGLRGEINGLRSQFHNDVVTIMGINVELDKRMSALEQK